jgi:hypothetical protein
VPRVAVEGDIVSLHFVCKTLEGEVRPLRCHIPGPLAAGGLLQRRREQSPSQPAHLANQ